MKKIILICALLAVVSCAPRTGMQDQSLQNNNLQTLSPVELRMVIAEMPKGADLHTHLSGIPYAEDYLKWAAEDNACIVKSSGKIVAGPCGDGTLAAKDAYSNAKIWNMAVSELSVRENRRDNQLWGHDQFFGAFGKMGVAKYNTGRLLAHAAKQADRDHVQYLEVMLSMYGPKSSDEKIVNKAWTGNFAESLKNLEDSDLYGDIEAVVENINSAEKEKSRILGKDPAKKVHIKYINQISRGNDPASVFAQLAFAFKLALSDSRVVGINLVGPEDGPIAMRDYELHMKMVSFFDSRWGHSVPITLHAGELTPALANPEGLSNHIGLIVDDVNARRIGHAVDLPYEKGAESLVKKMKKRQMAIEILLGSNDAILKVSGKEHPLQTYLKAGVPVVLASDDMGIARSTLTDEYVRAVLDQKLTYQQLKEAARNSLEYSFLDGGSLWVNRAYGNMVKACSESSGVKDECDKFLSGSPKADLQWNLEKQFKGFESKYPYLK
ncbi:adenosine deaminase [Maridesulfovibrio sp.]|uniref:adenosine deaminase family protein n=1 Tax=Maridesulfovibrio sp. TaxID=2795000 RepID=UPI002A18D151|nr:adenosine deaminase [Maridesulfovibrio sp.]